MTAEPTASINVTEAHIVKTPGICGGKARIDGHRIRVEHVYIWHELNGMSVQEIIEQYNLTHAQVYAALSYAFDNMDEIEAGLREEEEVVAEAMKRHPSKLTKKPSDE